MDEARRIEALGKALGRVFAGINRSDGPLGAALLGGGVCAGALVGWAEEKRGAFGDAGLGGTRLGGASSGAPAICLPESLARPGAAQGVGPALGLPAVGLSRAALGH